MSTELLTTAVDCFWLFFGGVLVFFMQTGFTMVEAGFTRSKNTGNIIMKNIVDFMFGSIIYWFIGYGLMYGEGNGFIGIPFGDMFMNGMAGAENMDYTALFFQTVFCATSATIVSGAMAERTNFKAYCIYSAAISLFIYPIAGHWVWGGGWLSQIGFADFAGSAAVHMCGGFAALMGAIQVGSRIGKYVNGKVNAIPGHNIPMGMLGAFILWIGWYGLNPGSELALDDVTSYTCITTTFAGAAVCLAGLFTSWIRYKKPDPTLVANGALGGLVAVCTGVAQVSYIGSMIIGAVAGILITLSIEFGDHKLHIDDPVGAISLHGVCGMTGTLLGGLLSTEDGLFYGFGASRFLAQLIGVVSIGAFVLITTGILYFVLKKTMGIRVPKEMELAGLDVTEHGMTAYPDIMG